MIEIVKYSVTELNTRGTSKYKRNSLEDLMYGADYVNHEFDTEEEAKEHMGKLKKEGIKTHLARIIRC